jgi:hypothetical protein
MPTMSLNNDIGTLIVDNIDKIFEHFNYYPIKKQKRYDGPCPIHEGDKYNAFNLYHTGYTTVGNWRCNTQGCHYVFDNTAFGLIKGLLSKENGWKGFGDKHNIVDDSEVVVFLRDVIGISEDMEYTKRNISSQIHNPNIKNRYNEIPSLGEIKSLYKKLGPPHYFMNRGFSKEILSKYYVGRCETFGRPMFMREVLPILDIDGKSLVGTTGRSINEECKRCKCYHFKNSPCPPLEKQAAYSKWKHSSVNMTHILYNIWNAKNVWQEKYSAILVESPQATWRFEEAGIGGCVASFGAHLTLEQSLLFAEFGVKTIYLVFDNDAAGENARHQVDFIAGNRYKTVNLRIPPKFNDPEEMTAEELKDWWTNVLSI